MKWQENIMKTKNLNNSALPPMLTLKWIWGEQCWPSYFISWLKGFLAPAHWPGNQAARQAQFCDAKNRFVHSGKLQILNIFAQQCLSAIGFCPVWHWQDTTTQLWPAPACLHSSDQQLNQALRENTFATEKYWFLGMRSQSVRCH